MMPAGKNVVYAVVYAGFVPFMAGLAGVPLKDNKLLDNKNL